MKKRKPSDPLSWFFQASIHGVTNRLWAEAACKDTAVYNIDRAKYWNQCPHNGQNSANFLPWHRGYTHHFEEILRVHTGEDDFAIPYWNYSDPANRTFPREFGIQHLDGNTQNDDASNLNPLFHPDRDYFLCGYEHPFTDQLPLTDLSSRAVDTSRVMSSEVFFGESESTGVGGGIADTDPSTRGLMEQSPHDQIHRAIGGTVVGTDGNSNPTTSIGAMAIPATAGFDPIFPVHHANIDRLWKVWACMPGKKWGKLPDKEWFDEKPWFFFDVDGKEVNRPRKDYFDYQTLGVSFKDDDLTCTPLQLPSDILTAALIALVASTQPAVESARALHVSTAIVAGITRPTAIPLLPSRSAENFDASMFTTDRLDETITITLRDVDLGDVTATGFDVFLMLKDDDPDKLTIQSPGYLGQISLFGHSGHFDQTFDATIPLKNLNRPLLTALTLVLVPYSLSTEPKVSTSAIPFRAGFLKSAGVSVIKGDKTSVPAGTHKH